MSDAEYEAIRKRRPLEAAAIDRMTRDERAALLARIDASLARHHAKARRTKILLGLALLLLAGLTLGISA